MEGKERLITLIGKKLAKKGKIFKFCGPSKECQRCRYRSVCINPLEKGRLYIIKDVKDRTHNCPIHDEGKVKVVEVEKAKITALIDSKRAFEGSTIVYSPQECNNKHCKLRKFCFPEGLFPGDRCTIVKVLGKVHECQENYDLTKVLLKID